MTKINPDYFLDCLERFYELPTILILELNNPKNLKVLENIDDRYGLELSFLVILVAIGELDLDDLAEYLALSYELNDELSQKIANQLFNNYFQPILNRISFLNPDPNKEKPTPEEEKNILINLFKNDLVDELNNYSDVVSAINQRVFALLSRKLEDKRLIENAILQNQEKITKQSVVIKEEKLLGTVSNWLNCFASEKGAHSFDSLSTSEFLSSSKNTKNLNDQEKKLLRSLFSTYRNIKFFPDSMPSDDGIGWEIIPVPDYEFNFDQPKTSSQSTESTETKASLPELPTEQSEKDLTKDLVKDPAIENKINQLQLMLKRYGPDTLEGQAITEELEKLNH